MPLNKKQLTPEQKRERGRSMLAKILIDDAKKEGKPNPFTRKTKDQLNQEIPKG